MKNNIVIISLFLILIFSASCDTDVNINSDYEEIPIVYCVLDPSSDYQYVKVNKAFYANGSASDIAQISDSLFFNNVQVVMREYRNSNYTGREWTFVRVDDIGKEPGYFANDRNTLYVSDRRITNYDADTEYELTVNIENGKHVLTSKTKLVYGASLLKPTASTRDVALNNYRGTFEYRYRAGYLTNIHQVVMDFNYFEVEGNDTTWKTVTMPLNKEVTASSYQNDIFERRFSISVFYDLITGSIKPTDRDIRRFVKMPDSFVFRLVSADENYYTYVQVSQPSTGIVQQKPSFTNIEGGYGLLAARFNEIVNCKMARSTIDTLHRGIYTKDLKFVSPWDNYYHPYFTQY